MLSIIAWDQHPSPYYKVSYMTTDHDKPEIFGNKNGHMCVFQNSVLLLFGVDLYLVQFLVKLAANRSCLNKHGLNHLANEAVQAVMITYWEGKTCKLATVVEGDQKAPFSIASTPKCK